MKDLKLIYALLLSFTMACSVDVVNQDLVDRGGESEVGKKGEGTSSNESAELSEDSFWPTVENVEPVDPEKIAGIRAVKTVRLLPQFSDGEIRKIVAFKNYDVIAVLFNAADKGYLHFLNASSGELIRDLKFEQNVGAMALRPDEREFVVATERGDLIKYDVATLKVLKRQEQLDHFVYNSVVNSLEYSPSNYRLFMGFLNRVTWKYKRRFRVFDAASLKYANVENKGYRLIVCPDSRKVIVDNYSLEFFRIQRDTEKLIHEEDKSIEPGYRSGDFPDFNCSPDGKTFVFLNSFNEVRKVDVARNRLLVSSSSQSDTKVAALGISPNSSLLALVASEGDEYRSPMTLTLEDPRSKRVYFEGPRIDESADLYDYSTETVFSGTGRNVVVGINSKRTLKLFKIETE